MSEDIHKHINASSNGGELLTDIEYECYALSKGFYITGNEVMGDTMHAMGKDIGKANELMRGALAGEINDRCREAQRGVGELVGMVLESSNNQMEAFLDEE